MARRYSEEFKQEAVRLYRSSGLGYRKVAAAALAQSPHTLS